MSSARPATRADVSVPGLGVQGTQRVRATLEGPVRQGHDTLRGPRLTGAVPHGKLSMEQASDSLGQDRDNVNHPRTLPPKDLDKHLGRGREKEAGHTHGHRTSEARTRNRESSCIASGKWARSSQRMKSAGPGRTVVPP